MGSAGWAGRGPFPLGGGAGAPTRISSWYIFRLRSLLVLDLRPRNTTVPCCGRAEAAGPTVPGPGTHRSPGFCYDATQKCHQTLRGWTVGVGLHLATAPSSQPGFLLGRGAILTSFLSIWERTLSSRGMSAAAPRASRDSLRTASSSSLDSSFSTVMPPSTAAGEGPGLRVRLPAVPTGVLRSLLPAPAAVGVWIDGQASSSQGQRVLEATSKQKEKGHRPVWLSGWAWTQEPQGLRCDSQ